MWPSVIAARLTPGSTYHLYSCLCTYFPYSWKSRYPRTLSFAVLHTLGWGLQGLLLGGMCHQVMWLPFRVDLDGDNAGEDTQEHKGLSERSQAVGAVLSLLLVALTGCLLTLLLYKKERR